MYDGDKQIGFARVITDNAIFAYLADVYVETDYQHQGLGKWLIEVILNSNDLKDVKTWMLLTDDAHGLYERYGFKSYAHPEKLMRLDKKSNEC
jgi:N-acetylglutamate synthase-like GNAT family acetyltransferase